MKNFTAILFCFILASAVLEIDAQRKGRKAAGGGGGMLGGLDIVGMATTALGETCVTWVQKSLCGGTCNPITIMTGLNKIPNVIQKAMSCTECAEPRNKVMNLVGPLMG